MSHYLLSYYVFFWFILYIFFEIVFCIYYIVYMHYMFYHILYFIILYYIILYIVLYIYIYMYVYAHTEWRMHVGISQSRPPTHQGWIARPCAQASVIPPICNAQRTHCQLPLSWGGSAHLVLHPFPKLPVTKTQKSGGWCQASKIDQFLAFLLIT